MKVFIAEFDLFQHVGGGQTAYRRVIETNPDIEFHYLRRDEKADAPRPANAHAIRFREPYRLTFAARPGDAGPPPWAYRVFVEAANVAATVAGREFDVVELADFRRFGAMLRPALAQHGVRFGRTALAMHGVLSTSYALDWPNPEGVDAALDLPEKAQYRAVDTRYGISRSYLDEWRAVCGLPSHCLHPLRLLEAPRPTLPPPSPDPPDLHFIGRTEKRKGPDTFVELAWWLPRTSFRSASIVGPESITVQGRGSNSYLQSLIANRRIDVAIRPAMTPAEMAALYAGRALIFVPSRYDTLNLVALESLLAGCPTVVGSGAGVCRFLRDTYPEVPFVELDVRNVCGALPEIADVLRNYDVYREKLVAAVRAARPAIDGPSLPDIYRSPPAADADVQRQMQQWYGELLQRYESTPLWARAAWTARRAAKSALPRPARNRLRAMQQAAANAGRAAPAALRKVVGRSIFRGEVKMLLHIAGSTRLARRYAAVLRLPEKSPHDLENKLTAVWQLAHGSPVHRACAWREIARLERLRGNDLVAATYELRVMRALGEDRFGLLPATAAALAGHGFRREADTARAMFAPLAEREAACTSILEDALRRHAANPDGRFERIDDRRPPGSVRASIVVSLYNAADKLSFFLHALKNQTLFAQLQAEVILIDSGSPDREYEVFRRVMQELNLPVVYARSADRETIQSAWNRGIRLARAPYLAFLGVDEMVLPDAIETLAGELDRDPALDWVQGSSLVTAVDKHGVWKDDVMTYDRSGYKPTLLYLDTCYQTYVGSLYRRTIHDRCGYYDASFRAAGDTEFKNRALPHIRTKTLPRILGVFWNYPDERTTESPRAEIEDLRAWYLHRTLAGVECAFARRDPREAAETFFTSLRYRKSFCRHLSTDVEYAANVAEYLTGRSPDALAAGHREAIARVLAAYRSLDWLPRLSRWLAARALLRAHRVAHNAQARQRRLGPPGVEPLYGIFNDNRYEQHTHVWRSATA